MVIESKEFMKPQAHNFIVVAQNLDIQPSTATWQIITGLKSDLRISKMSNFVVVAIITNNKNNKNNSNSRSSGTVNVRW